MDKNESPRQPVSFIGIINIGLSFLGVFVGLWLLLSWAWMFYYGNRWVEASFDAPGRYFLLTVGISTVMGVINAVGYFRKKYR